MRELGILDLMLPAFCECLVLVGIHSYLGLHVIRRKVIFVDLALAQVAALGTTVGFLFGMAPDSVAALIFSVAFTFMAAAVFSVARLKSDKVPQEAIIGLVYAIAAAVVILVIDRAPHGAEHIKEVMTGAILWVQWESIAFAAVVYAVIGAIHYVFRRQFLLISNDPDEAYRRGMSVRLWDFFFYVTFGVVISISVRTAGVLLVFVFLVVPAITATLVTDRLRWQLVIGWTMGTLVTVFGLLLSYVADMPSGPTVVSFYGVMLVLAAVLLYLGRRRSRDALARVGLGVAVVAASVVGLYLGGRALGGSSLAIGRSHVHGEISLDAEQCDDCEHDDHGHHEGDAHEDTEPLHGDHDDGGRLEELVDQLGRGEDASLSRFVDDLGEEGRVLLEDAFEQVDDEALRLAAARQLGRAHDARAGGRLLLRLVRDAQFPFIRAEAVRAMSELAREPFEGYDAEADAEANAEAIDAMERWLAGPAE